MNLDSSQASWQIKWSFPESLQFASVVGQLEGVDPSPDANAGSTLERDWRTWWELLVSNSFSVDTAMQQPMLATPEDSVARVRENRTAFSPRFFTASIC